MPNLPRALACTAAAACLVLAATRPAVAGRTRAGRRPRVQTPLPAMAPPKVSLSTAADYYRSAEARLALFITNLQTGHRKRAAEMLSSHASEADRQALIEKKWLRRDPRARKDFHQLLYLPDVQIRTRQFGKEAAVCYILPRKKISRKSGLPVGYLPVRMVREHDRWFVDLRPPKVASSVFR